MRKRIIPFPRINQSAGLETLGVDVDWKLSDGVKELEYEVLASSRQDLRCRITDKTWYPDVCQLTVRFAAEIKNPIKLFSGVHGNKGCEVAASSSMLGCALKWKISKTNLQGAYHCRDIVFGSGGKMRFSGTLDLPPKSIRFALAIELVLYLKEADGNRPNIYARSKGSILGVIGSFILETGGSGGYFPTVTEKVDGGPLWKVFANISCAEDFDEDFSADYFHLSLNESHLLYDRLYVTSRNGKVYVSPLLFEAFVNACVILTKRACCYIADRSWVLNRDEKDDPSIYVNFKSFKRACLPDYSNRQLCEMELEELFLAVRMGLSRHILIDTEGPAK